MHVGLEPSGDVLVADGDGACLVLVVLLHGASDLCRVAVGWGELK